MERAPTRPPVQSWIRTVWSELAAILIDAEATNDSVTVRFDSPGIVTELTVSVQVAGPAGLFWWRRVQNITIEPAPPAAARV